MEDHDIERVARRLGARAGDRLDVERVAAGVAARLRQDGARVRSPRPSWWASPVALRLAAALAVLIGSGVLARGVLRHPAARPTTVVSVPILRELTNDELLEVFDSLGVETPVHEGLAGGLESLNEAQLKELLSLMEG
jgi:hypothetical protein